MIEDANPFLFTSQVYALDKADVDTDQIIPKQFMAGVTKQGLGRSLFYNWRYLNGDYDKPSPDFVLNDPNRKDARILLAQNNFGCGSSREHAQWAIADFGIRCIIAPSFADIFYQNCIYNQILPVALPKAEVNTLFALSKASAFRLRVNLIDNCIHSADGTFYAAFDISEDNRHVLLNNLDSISLTEVFSADIDAFEKNALVGVPESK